MLTRVHPLRRPPARPSPPLFECRCGTKVALDVGTRGDYVICSAAIRGHGEPLPPPLLSWNDFDAIFECTHLYLRLYVWSNRRRVLEVVAE